MGMYKDNRPTKDGKIWFYKTQDEDIDSTHKTKKSGRYATKKEAEKILGFNDNFFVAGDMLPICSNTPTNHKNVNCKLADVKQI